MNVYVKISDVVWLKWSNHINNTIKLYKSEQFDHSSAKKAFNINVFGHQNKPHLQEFQSDFFYVEFSFSEQKKRLLTFFIFAFVFFVFLLFLYLILFGILFGIVIKDSAHVRINHYHDKSWKKAHLCYRHITSI